MSAVSGIFIATVLPPTEEGVNVTATVQLAPPAREAPHGFAPPATPEKSAAFGPTIVAGSVRPIEEDVLFVSVTNSACDGLPTSWIPKARLVGDTEIVGTMGNCAINALTAPVAPSAD